MSIFSRKRKPIDLTYLTSMEAYQDQYEVEGRPYRLASVVAVGKAHTGLATREIQMTFVRQ